MTAGERRDYLQMLRGDAPQWRMHSRGRGLLDDIPGAADAVSLSNLSDLTTPYMVFVGKTDPDQKEVDRMAEDQLLKYLSTRMDVTLPDPEAEDNLGRMRESSAGASSASRVGRSRTSHFAVLSRSMLDDPQGMPEFWRARRHFIPYKERARPPIYDSVGNVDLSDERQRQEFRELGYLPKWNVQIDMIMRWRNDPCMPVFPLPSELG